MANSRIRNLTPELTLTSEHTLAVDSPTYNLENARSVTAADIKTFVWKIIIDPAVITNITKESSWNSDGDYTGAYTGLVAGDIYTDMSLRIRYEYDGEVLIRYHINNVT